jgi:Signal peptidase, peptidase S26
MAHRYARSAAGVFGKLVLVAVCGVLLMAQAAAQSATFQRGDRVRVRTPTRPSDPTPADMVLTVVAGPNDHIRVSDSSVYVNEEAISGFSREFLDRVAHSNRTPEVVPEGHYFVMGEVQWTVEDISNYWGVMSASSLETARPR